MYNRNYRLYSHKWIRDLSLHCFNLLCDGKSLPLQSDIKSTWMKLRPSWIKLKTSCNWNKRRDSNTKRYQRVFALYIFLRLYKHEASNLQKQLVLMKKESCNSRELWRLTSRRIKDYHWLQYHRSKLSRFLKRRWFKIVALWMIQKLNLTFAKWRKTLTNSQIVRCKLVKERVYKIKMNLSFREKRGIQNRN